MASRWRRERYSRTRSPHGTQSRAAQQEEFQPREPPLSPPSTSRHPDRPQCQCAHAASVAGFDTSMHNSATPSCFHCSSPTPHSRHCIEPAIPQPSHPGHPKLWLCGPQPPFAA
eukprot:943683-Prymnesium_polylepis.1